MNPQKLSRYIMILTGVLVLVVALIGLRVLRYLPEGGTMKANVIQHAVLSSDGQKVDQPAGSKILYHKEITSPEPISM